MFPSFALSSAPLSCHHGRGNGAVGVDEGVPDLTPARDLIWSIMKGAELGRGSRSGLYHC